METEFKAVGAILVVLGVMLDEQGQPVRDLIKIECQGVCEPLLQTREGLAQVHSFLLRATEHIAGLMVTAPSRAEAEARPLIVPASALPHIPMRNGGN